jgi:hypothetical protein
MKGNTMKKQNDNVFVSVSTLGYNAAKAGDALKNAAILALDNVPDIAAAEKLQDVSKETKAEFYTGARQRWNEINPAVDYVIVNGNYIRLDSLDNDGTKVSEKVKIGADVAFALTQQEFGALKESEPQRHAIIKSIRDACNAYCSNAFGTLFRKAKQIQKERRGESATRQQALAYAAWIEKILDDMKTRVISAESRGDVTADKKKLEAAVIAFKTKFFS